MPSITIDSQLEIEASELHFSFSRSGGPGGQNVNKVATKATLTFDIAGSPSLDEPQRILLLSRLAHRLTKDGRLQVSRQGERSQSANRRAAFEAFVSLLQDALDIPRDRRPTKPSRGVNERRISNKKHRSRIKESRGRVRNRDHRD